MSRRGPEGKVQDDIRKYLDSIKDSFWVKPTVTNKRGCPDIIGDIQGLAVYIEVKKDRATKPTKIQQYYLDRATQRGAIGFCAYSATQCREALESFCRSKGIQLSYLLQI